MSVTKLMSRIVAPSHLDGKDNDRIAETLHDHTYGITSDPLTQFACAFSALIHDVDHTGVPNTELVQEQPELATIYGGRSVAEQNSLDISWELLMGDEFSNLRRCLFDSQKTLNRFRSLVVNSLMATDIADQQLKKLRNNRWEKAFAETLDAVEESSRDAINRKATIVIEHLIQASDISHTMQHWHVYRKWNERLFMEMYQAFRDGRSDKNPADFWAKGEIGFFDFYIIPLAKKLKECGVFGVSSGEFLGYAIENRRTWEQQGADVVSEMMEKIKDNNGEAVF